MNVDGTKKRGKRRSREFAPGISYNNKKGNMTLGRVRVDQGWDTDGDDLLDWLNDRRR